MNLKKAIICLLLNTHGEGKYRKLQLSLSHPVNLVALIPPDGDIPFFTFELFFRLI